MGAFMGNLIPIVGIVMTMGIPMRMKKAMSIKGPMTLIRWI